MQIQADNIILLVIIITFIFLIAGAFLLVYVNLYNEKKRKHVEEKESIKRQFEQTLLQSQLEIQEQTLQHVSRELHDNLGQVASLIKINLNTLRLADIDKAAVKIENTKELTRQLITDLKGLSVSLDSDHLSRTGFIRALEIEIERLNKTGEFTASFKQTGEIVIANDKAIILYRMMQEILNNCIRHSKAKHINITANNQENKYILAISDDGIGFNKDELTNQTSAGLNNLQNRAHLINAQLRISSIPGNGTTITIDLPV